jgi:hypothetical protein
MVHGSTCSRHRRLLPALIEGSWRKIMQHATHICFTGFCPTNASCSFLPLTTSPAALHHCCPTSTLASSSRCACTQPSHPLGTHTNIHYTLLFLTGHSYLDWADDDSLVAGRQAARSLERRTLTLLIYSDVFHWSTYGQDLGGSFVVAARVRFH